jgi:orotidine-5'-phosphate decarboxylase
MDDFDLVEAGYGRDAAGLVALRAQQAVEAGIGGVVVSPLEAALVHAIVGGRLAIVTPGIRPAGSARGDQKRIMGPAEAIAEGATHLVVGRPITAAPEPAVAARAILAEMAGGTRLA